MQDITKLLEEKNALSSIIANGDISAANMAYIYENNEDFVINPDNVWITEKDINFNNFKVIQYGVEVSEKDFFSLSEALVINDHNLRLYKPDYNF